jgi:hypothetical protein
VAETVTYLDFGTAHVHLAAPDGGTPPAVALCGMGASRYIDDPRPGSFDDRPGLYPAEMCKRCREISKRKRTADATS